MRRWDRRHAGRPDGMLLCNVCGTVNETSRAAPLVPKQGRRGGDARTRPNVPGGARQGNPAARGNTADDGRVYRFPAPATTRRRAWPARLFRPGGDSELGWCVAVLLGLAYTLGLVIVHNTVGHRWWALAWNVLLTLPVVVLQ